MSPALQAVIEAAEDLAWRPTSNLGRGDRYNDRKASHQRLVDALRAWPGGLSANASDELRYLVAAIRRVAACSWCNRMGLAYESSMSAVWYEALNALGWIRIDASDEHHARERLRQLRQDASDLLWFLDEVIEGWDAR